ncbi:hypothetical protein DL95DRAFT_485772 [Leptodontidium sp. 2 PMI_412]|nr:hypothetical protein DL95DRAFT_485772 [Leptodontidium sp. 2 PMI_412]
MCIGHPIGPSTDRIGDMKSSQFAKRGPPPFGSKDCSHPTACTFFSASVHATAKPGLSRVVQPGCCEISLRDGLHLVVDDDSFNGLLDVNVVPCCPPFSLFPVDNYWNFPGQFVDDSSTDSVIPGNSSSFQSWSSPSSGIRSEQLFECQANIESSLDQEAGHDDALDPLQEYLNPTPGDYIWTSEFGRAESPPMFDVLRVTLDITIQDAQGQLSISEVSTSTVPEASPSNIVDDHFNASSTMSATEDFSSSTSLSDFSSLSSKRRDTSVGTPSGDAHEAKRIRHSRMHRCHWKNCAEDFAELAMLRSHLRSHSRSASGCLWSGCSRVLKNTSTLNKHLDTHIKPHVCSNCQHQTATPRDLARHVRSHGMQSGTIIFYCPAASCPWHLGGSKRPFARRDNAVRHVTQMHPGFAAPPISGTFQPQSTHN